jgi:hypothetical protein
MIKILVHFVSCLYIMNLVNAQNMEHVTVQYQLLILSCLRCTISDSCYCQTQSSPYEQQLSLYWSYHCVSLLIYQLINSFLEI